jgi:hypothetical protein
LEKGNYTLYYFSNGSIKDIEQHEAHRRRAEQSARDKERHRRALEERGNVEYMPPTPVSTHGKPGFTKDFVEDIQTCIVPDYLFVA